MNTWNRFIRASASLLATVLVSALCASSAMSQGVYTTVMSTQSFTSASPSGWSIGGGFYWTSNGNGGSNGSYYIDIWGCQQGPLKTPSFDVSSYAATADSVWVDFDFFWQYNCYDSYGYGDDNFKLMVGSDILLQGTQATLYSYYNTSDCSYSTIQTNSAYWHHYHILIPVADRTSGMAVAFTQQCGWGCSDYAIDNVSITGYALPPTQLSLEPKSLNYGGVSSGSSLTLYDTAYCLGPASMKINGYGIAGAGASSYSVVSGPPVGSIILPGQYGVYGIRFAPISSGNLNGTFTLSTNGKDSGTQVCQLNGVGAAAGVQYSFPYNESYPPNSLFHHVARPLGDSATQYFYVASTGVAGLNFNSVYFTGLQANMYSIIHLPPSPLPSGVTDSIGVRFKPWLEGRPDAQLIVNTNAINNPSDTVSLWGAGVLAHLVITPQEGLTTTNGAGTLLFDSVAIGDSICKSLTLHNTGSDTLQITNQVVTYGDYDFTFYPLTGSDVTLPPDASKIVNVCFKPIKQGARFASVRFYTSIPKTYPDNRDTSQFLVNVSGTGVPYGILSLAGTVLDSVLLDSTKCTSATIKNVGLSSLVVTTATISGSTNFAVSTTPPLPITLGAGQSQLIDICYTPTARGPEAATLVLTGTTSGRPLTQSLPLEGVGLAACLDAAPSPLAFGSAAYSGMTLANTENDTCITVTNCGDVPETFSAALSPGTSNAYSLIAPFIIGPIAPGGTGTLCVAFKPDTIGIMPGSVIVSASEKSATAKTLPLAGTGAGVVIAGSGQGTLT
ncbi:MAG: choice-of-anchor D domain-containing protein, partial [Bacteroidota bacterium]|nr:choice-of-anchor D domain-containing protein [Bacteroidota bacterium]